MVTIYLNKARELEDADSATDLRSNHVVTVREKLENIYMMHMHKEWRERKINDASTVPN